MSPKPAVRAISALRAGVQRSWRAATPRAEISCGESGPGSRNLVADRRSGRVVAELTLGALRTERADGDRLVLEAAADVRAPPPCRVVRAAPALEAFERCRSLRVRV